MRPTDKEIEDQKNTLTPNKYVHVFEAGFEKGAKWARDFDPWYYTEDGDLPEFDTPVLVFLDNEEANKDVAELIDCGDNKTYEWLCQGDVMGKDEDCIELDQVKCWMYIPQPKR